MNVRRYAVQRGETIPYRLPPNVLALFLFTVCISLAFFLPVYLRGNGVDIDFEAFYCAGDTVLHGADPYRQQPLQSCEDRVHWGFARGDLVIPAPLPGAAIGAFVPVALIPYGIARVAWLLLSLGLIAASIAAIVRLYGIGWPAVAVPLLLTMSISLTLGQLVPWCLFGMLLAAWGLRSDRPLTSAAGIALTVAQPSVFLPLALSVVLFGPVRHRVAALGAAAVLAIASLLVLGVAANVEYVRSVLPLQAFAELTNMEQYSLAGVLAQSGVPARAALVAGEVSYALAAIAGIAAGRTLFRRSGDAAYLAIVPCAFAVFLGTYVHAQMYALALPLALVVAVRTQSRIAGAAMAILAVPWQWFVLTLYLLPAFALAYVVCLRLWVSRSLLACAFASLAASVAAGWASIVFIARASNHAPSFSYAARPGDLAQYAWIAAERLFGELGRNPGLDAGRLAGIAALAYVLAVSVRSRALGASESAA